MPITYNIAINLKFLQGKKVSKKINKKYGTFKTN